MVSIKNEEQIKYMKTSGKVVYEVLELLKSLIKVHQLLEDSKTVSEDVFSRL